MVYTVEMNEDPFRHAMADTASVTKCVDQTSDASKSRKICCQILGVMIGIIIVAVVTSLSIFYSNHGNETSTEAATKPPGSVQVHCEWNDWNIGHCSQSCGGGVVKNTRTEKYKAVNGGKECDGPTSIEESCNVQNCPVHCEWNAWIVGDCSVSCGGGFRTKFRTEKYAAENGGKECEGPTSIEESCNMQECPVVTRYRGWWYYKKSGKRRAIIDGNIMKLHGTGTHGTFSVEYAGHSNITVNMRGVRFQGLLNEAGEIIWNTGDIWSSTHPICRDDPSGTATRPDYTNQMFRMTARCVDENQSDLCVFSWFAGSCQHTCGICNGGCSDWNFNCVHQWIPMYGCRHKDAKWHCQKACNLCIN